MNTTHGFAPCTTCNADVHDASAHLAATGHWPWSERVYLTPQPWPTAEQFDAASAAGSTYAQAQIQNGATAAREYPLMGEYADDPSPRDIARSVGFDPQTWEGNESTAVDELADAWERGYFDTWAHA